MDFEILSELRELEVIATGKGIRELARLRRMYGKGRWRKLKAKATVRLTTTNEIREEEIHWYEAHGIGKREFKIKFRAQ